jgi:hypothetical protein
MHVASKPSKQVSLRTTNQEDEEMQKDHVEEKHISRDFVGEYQSTLRWVKRSRMTMKEIIEVVKTIPRPVSHLWS